MNKGYVSRVELALYIWEREKVFEQLCDISNVILSDKKENFSLIMEDKMSSETFFDLYEQTSILYSLMNFYEEKHGEKDSVIKFKNKKKDLKRFMDSAKTKINKYTFGLSKRIKELEEKVFNLENKDYN